MSARSSPDVQGVVFAEASLGYRGVDKHDVYVSPLTQLAIKTIRKSVNKLGIVSSQPYSLLQKILQAYKIRVEWFDGVVAYEDCQAQGEDPQRYQQITEALQLGDDPSRVVVFEAMLDGIVAAQKAGCYVVGLTFFHSHKELFDAGANTSVPSYFQAIPLLEKMKSKPGAKVIMADRNISPLGLHAESSAADNVKEY